MDTKGFRQRVAASRVAPLAALPIRLRSVGQHDARVLSQSIRWLVRSREHTNYTYDLTPLNREHLAWWVAAAAGVPVSEARSYMTEVEQDNDLTMHVLAATQASDRRALADRHVRLHKRIGWYALVRALRPAHVVETGTDKGLGSVVLAAALLRNGGGKLTTLDVNSDAGYLISGDYASVTDLRIGDSLTGLARMETQVDFFLHDSLHTREHELAEYEAVAPRLGGRAVVLSDNAHATDALPAWAEKTGRRFSYFQERPGGHWYPGGGIGLAQFVTPE
jgi:predicted O-methyltransferase YrrM